MKIKRYKIILELLESDWQGASGKLLHLLICPSLLPMSGEKDCKKSKYLYLPTTTQPSASLLIYLGISRSWIPDT